MDRKGDNPFTIAAAPVPTAGHGHPVSERFQGADPTQRIRSMVSASEIFLLIKGTPRRPQNTVAIIEGLGIPYQTFDVLSDESIRTAAKDYSSWPTFPQIYLKGEFIGGNDILMEMNDAGELQELVSGSGA